MKLFGFEPGVQEMLFTDIAYLQLWWPSCLAEQNHLGKFDRRHYEEHFCEIIFNLDQWFNRRCCFEIFLIYSSGSRPSVPFGQF